MHVYLSLGLCGSLQAKLLYSQVYAAEMFSLQIHSFKLDGK